MRGEFPTPVRKIISGGQTGVDRGALDAALELQLPHGGWCPLGRLAEDGFIPTRYALRQTSRAGYATRTERNLLEADGTLIVYRQCLTGGSELTRQLCVRHRKPVLLVDLHATVDIELIRRWLNEMAIKTLNIAGPRESSCPGICVEACQLIVRLLDAKRSEKELSEKA